MRTRETPDSPSSRRLIRGLLSRLGGIRRPLLSSASVIRLSPASQCTSTGSVAAGARRWVASAPLAPAPRLCSSGQPSRRCSLDALRLPVPPIPHALQHEGQGCLHTLRLLVVTKRPMLFSHCSSRSGRRPAGGLSRSSMPSERCRGLLAVATSGLSAVSA
jgi:hypothetical protein